MIGKFIWHTKDGDYTIELHWVDGKPLWVVDNEAIEYLMNKLYGDKPGHPDSPGYPYWWLALMDKKTTILKLPHREVDPPPGAIY